MNRFAHVLQRARDRLQVPEPSRSRILLEMSADLEDSYQYFLDQGYEEADAVRRAEEAFGTSEDALEHLVRIHQNCVGGLVDRVSSQVGSVWEKVLLLVILVFEVWLAIKVLLDRSFFVYVSPFLWPILAVALAAFLFSVSKLYQIFASSGRDVRRLRTGLGTMLFLGGMSLSLSVCGFLFHLQRFLRFSSGQELEALWMNFAGWIIGVSSMMTVGLLTVIFTGLVWFVLTSLVARTERSEIESLLSQRG